MKIDSQRFGALEVSEEEVLNFPSGIIGFEKEPKFVLVPHGSSSFLAWLQSVNTPELALPVVSAHAFGEKYPDVPIQGILQSAGIATGSEEVAILVVLCANRSQPSTVNLLAPIVVNAETRQAAQIILEGTRFSTRELFVLPANPEASAPTESAALAAG